jgi:hypothetical protein
MANLPQHMRQCWLSMSDARPLPSASVLNKADASREIIRFVDGMSNAFGFGSDWCQKPALHTNAAGGRLSADLSGHLTPAFDFAEDSLSIGCLPFDRNAAFKIARRGCCTF